MDNILRIYMIRHGETIAQEKGLFSGRTDLSLTERGRVQAFCLSGRKDLESIMTCVSSPLARCIETSEMVFGGKRIIVDEGLCEMDFGHWEMKTWNEIEIGWPEDAAKWASMEKDFIFPGGEGIRAFYERVKSASLKISEYAVEQDLRKIAISTHGGVIRSLICSWLGLPKEMMYSFSVDIGSVSCVTVAGGFASLSFLNDRSHLNLMSGDS